MSWQSFGCCDVLPIVVEEEVEVVCLRIKQVRKEYVDKVGDAFGQLGHAPHAIKVGVWLEDVQVRVHRSRPILVFLAQSHVGNGLPVAR